MCAPHSLRWAFGYEWPLKSVRQKGDAHLTLFGESIAPQSSPSSLSVSPYRYNCRSKRNPFYWFYRTKPGNLELIGCFPSLCRTSCGMLINTSHLFKPSSSSNNALAHIGNGLAISLRQKQPVTGTAKHQRMPISANIASKRFGSIHALFIKLIRGTIYAYIHIIISNSF